MMRKIFTILTVVVLILGIGFLLYPSIAKDFNTHKTDKVVDEFKLAVEQVNKNDPKNDDKSGDKSDKDKALQNSSSHSDQSGDSTVQNQSGATYFLDREKLDKLYQKLVEYNNDLKENGQSNGGNPFIFEDQSVDLSEYGITNGVIGYISIPAIDMNLPIYLGANEYNMAIGAAHLNKTSVPIGGESTNCAIAGHRGMINKIMFDNIVYLNKGDDVYIVNYWETLHYRVRETKIIDPEDSNSLLIEKGKDLVSLITCHPYGSNSQRFLVICERVKQ